MGDVSGEQGMIGSYDSGDGGWYDVGQGGPGGGKGSCDMIVRPLYESLSEVSASGRINSMDFGGMPWSHLAFGQGVCRMAEKADHV